MDFMVNGPIKKFLKCFEQCFSSEEVPYCLQPGLKHEVSSGCCTLGVTLALFNGEILRCKMSIMVTFKWFIVIIIVQ